MLKTHRGGENSLSRKKQGVDFCSTQCARKLVQQAQVVGAERGPLCAMQELGGFKLVGNISAQQGSK